MFDRRDDPASLLTSLERMTRTWFWTAGEAYGIDEQKLAATRLPTPLRWLYGFAGEWRSDNNWESLFAFQDVLLPFECLSLEHGKLVFVVENQAVWRAGTLPDGDDPPVWIQVPDEPWQKLCDSLTHFLLTFCLHEMVLGSRYIGSGDNLVETFSNAGCHISPIWLDGPYVKTWDDDLQRPMSFHMVDGRFLVMENHWCGTFQDEPWNKFPILFQEPEPEPATQVPLLDNLSVPASIRRTHLQGLIARHENYARYHQEMAEKYALRLNALDTN